MSTRRNEKKRRICYLAPDVVIPSPRGSSVHVSELSKNLCEIGYEVHIVCRRLRTQSAFEKLDGLYVHRVYRWMFRPESISSFSEKTNEKSGTLSFFYYLYLRTVFTLFVGIIATRLVWKYKLNLVLERETSFGAGGLASTLSREPLILEIIGPRYSRFSAWRSEKILFYTESMLRKWVDRRKCVPIPAGVNLSLFSPDPLEGISTRRKLGFKEDDIVIGYVGTFQDWHGIETMLSALSLLQRKLPNLKALLVGPSFERYSRQAEEMGVSSLCRFTGPVDYPHVPAYVNACDIMLALYNPRANALRNKYGLGWPIKIMEYMACKKPVISTKVDPVNRIISSDEVGILVAPGDASDLASAIERLTGDPALREQMEIKGFELVSRNYSWSALAAKISSLISNSGKV